MPRNLIRNTTADVRSNPLAALLTMCEPGSIERSEAAGQRQLLASEVLPVDTRGGDAEFIALGFTFGEPVQGDEIFRAATLPEGWKREGSDHAMWSYIVDGRGFKRVAVFYKAAYYDRSASMSVSNVGYGIGSDAIYGDGPITAESLRLSILTADERAELVKCADSMRKNIAEYPDIYGKYADRLAMLDRAMNSHA